MPKINANALDMWADAAPHRTSSKGQVKGAKRPSQDQRALEAYRHQQRKMKD